MAGYHWQSCNMAHVPKNARSIVQLLTDILLSLFLSGIEKSLCVSRPADGSKKSLNSPNTQQKKNLIQLLAFEMNKFEKARWSSPKIWKMLISQRRTTKRGFHRFFTTNKNTNCWLKYAKLMDRKFVKLAGFTLKPLNQN